MTKYRVVGIREFQYENEKKGVSYPACNLYLVSEIVPRNSDISAQGLVTSDLFCRAEMASNIAIDDLICLYYEKNGQYATLVEIEKVGHVGE